MYTLDCWPGKGNNDIEVIPGYVGPCTKGISVLVHISTYQVLPLPSNGTGGYTSKNRISGFRRELVAKCPLYDCGGFPNRGSNLGPWSQAPNPQQNMSLRIGHVCSMQRGSTVETMGTISECKFEARCGCVYIATSHMAINYITGRVCESWTSHGSSTIPIQQPITEQYFTGKKKILTKLYWFL